MMSSNLEKLECEICACRRCARLVAWRERVGREKVRRYAQEEYWSRPAPGFGDPAAWLWIIGLAPAAHGANRTGRVFTGDRSGDWLFRALHRAGFANQPTSEHRDDGLALSDCYISAAVRCAPPANKPLPEEYQACRPYLVREAEALKRVQVIVVLGKIAFDQTLLMLAEARGLNLKPRPKFAHGAEHVLAKDLTLLCSYHPSQQNTFTGVLTEPMFDQVFSRARQIIRGV